MADAFLAGGDLGGALVFCIDYFPGLALVGLFSTSMADSLRHAALAEPSAA